MSTITSVKLWYDTGYTEGSSEIPPVGHTLGTPDLVLTGPFTPAKGRLFSELQVKESYTDLMNCSYLEVELELNNGLPSKTFYGWIDDISISSDNTNYPMTIIKWHVDLWRTFNQHAEYGSGFVVRRPSTSDDFYQNYPYNNIKVKESTELVTRKWLDDQASSNVLVAWVIVVYTDEDSSKKVTKQTTITFPVLVGVSRDYSSYIADGTHHYPSFDDVVHGKWDEQLGIDPARISAAWITPICPLLGWDYSVVAGGLGGFDYITYSDDPPEYSIKDYKEIQNPHLPAGNNIWMSAMYFTGFRQNTLTGTLTVAKTCVEGHELIITGFNGEKIGTIPYKKTVQTYTVRPKISAISAMFEIRFDGIDSSPEGLQFDIPFDSLDSNENSWSSYVYSGEREYDRNMRNQNTIKGGIEGSISGAGSGAMAGSLVAPGIGTAIGAGVGFAASAFTSTLEYTVFNDKFQDLEDKYHAAQSEGIITSGFGLDTVTYGKSLSIVETEYDSNSLAIMSDIKEVQGTRFNAPVADCTSLINTGGPLQITNLIVKGDIPVAAKKWIKQKFADGVRIVSR